MALHVPRQFPEGETGVELTFFGAACGLYGWVLQALERTVRRGLGKVRSRWELGEIVHLRPGGRRERLCGGDLRQLPTTIAPQHLELASEVGFAPDDSGERVEVVLQSPTRLTLGGRLLTGSEPVPLDLLVARILDRFAALFGDNADPWLAPDVRRQLEEGARSASLLEDSTRWLEVADYSARTRSELLMSGKVGRMVYGGVALPLLPVLRAGEVLHVGKNPGFGCGRLAVSVLD
jgi:hypothetical protein